MSRTKHEPNGNVRGEAGSRVIGIVGMHRSGTSCLAGSLQEAGLFLGEVVTQGPFNKKGSRENLSIIRMQEQLLRDNYGSWDNPPATVIWTDTHKESRDRIIAHFADRQVWGFKDPRTLLTIYGWLDALPEMMLVGTFRHPLAVAASHASRNHFPAEKTINLWYDYNRRMLDFYTKFRFPIVNFDVSSAVYLRGLCKLSELLELTPPADGFAFFDQTIKSSHSRQSEPLPEHIDELYNKLIDVSFK